VQSENANFMKSTIIFLPTKNSPVGHDNTRGDKNMAKRQKDPSKAAVSAASVQGNAGPGNEPQHKNKVNSQNNQYKK
jgi:hypothetical protein